MTPGQRLAVSALPAALVTLLLVAFMQFLISEKPFQDSDARTDPGIRFGTIELPEPTPPTVTPKPPDRVESHQPPGLDDLGLDPDSNIRVAPGDPQAAPLPPVVIPPIAGPGSRSQLSLDRELVAVSQAQPLYPPDAIMQGIEGWVEVEFTVRVDGSTADVRVLRAEPRNVFERHAMAAVLRWRFQPPIVDGAVLPTRTQQRIDFVLAE